MNQRTLVVIALLGLLVIGLVFIAPGGKKEEPFNRSEKTLPNQTETPSETNISDNLTAQQVQLSTLRLAQQNKFEAQINTTRRDTDRSSNILWTHEASYQLVKQNGTVLYEKYYSISFTAVKEYTSNGPTTYLEDPNKTIVSILDYNVLIASARSTNLELVNQYEENDVTYRTYESNSLTTNGRRLAAALNVDEIVRVNEITITQSENGVITSGYVDVTVIDNGERFDVTKEYTIQPRQNVTIPKPVWVQQTIGQNAGIDAFKISDSELVLRHNYGASLFPGDIIRITTPSGKQYTIQIPNNTSFGPGDAAVITVDETGNATITINPDSKVTGETAFMEKDGVYEIVFWSEGRGILHTERLE